MKKYIINYGYDKEDDKFVAVCPEFFGFIIYCDSMEELKKNSLTLLKIYAKDKSITGKNIEFVEKRNELEMSL